MPTILILVALFQKIHWRGEIKRNARAQFQNNAWGKFALIYTGIWIIIGLVSRLLASIPLLNILFTLAVTGLVSYGTVDVLRKICRGQDFTINDFLPTENLSSMLALTFVKDIYLFLWSLLFAIPGLIKAYSYSQVYYIANENPGLSIDEVITQSREMMDGHKWELFCLEFSYLGWLILCVLTLGILTLWVGPKMELAKYTFYRNISGQGLKDQPEEFEVEEDQFTIKIE